MKLTKLYSNLTTYYNLNAIKYNLQNPLFVCDKSKQVLSWNNFLGKVYFDTYEEYFLWVIDNLQYSIKIEDRGLIQIYFEGENVNKGSLAFLPHPESFMSYFRIDFDQKNAKHYKHNSYHVNFGYNSDNMRLSVKKLPFPSEFINFCLFLLGQKEIERFSKNNFFSDLDSIPEDYNHFFDLKI